ncbi:MAG: flavin reductase family protein, partial [Pseudomonadota bacterium]
HEGEKFGITVSSMTSLTADPPRLLACVNVAGRSFAAISQSGRMSVNVLASEQELIARRFAGMLTETADPFTSADWMEPADGPPYLDKCLASFDCRVSEMLVTHSHAILIGDVETVRVTPGRTPLLYMDGSFKTTSD